MMNKELAVENNKMLAQIANFFFQLCFFIHTANLMTTSFVLIFQ